MTDEPRPAADEQPSRGPSEPLMLALIGLGIAVLLFAASALPVLLAGDDDGDLDELAVRPAVTVEPSVATSSPTEGSGTVAAGGDADADADADPDADGSASVATSTPDSTAPTAATDAAGASTATSDTTDAGIVEDEPSDTTAAPPDEVPESRATVLEGKIYLEGAVPDEAARDAIVALAAEILGPDNVVDGYTIDPRASDPNLGQVLVADAVLFETDSAVIASDFEPLLNQGLALLTIRPAANFVIIGHTDSRGTDAYNDFLSQERALSIVRWYAARGIDGSRLTAIGRGEREPIASNDTAEGRQQNRRIEVVIENLLSEPEPG